MKTFWLVSLGGKTRDAVNYIAADDTGIATEAGEWFRRHDPFYSARPCHQPCPHCPTGCTLPDLRFTITAKGRAALEGRA